MKTRGPRGNALKKWLSALSLISSAALVAGGCASPAPSSGPGTAPGAGTEPAGEAGPESRSAPAEPEGGEEYEWLVDEEGRTYRVLELPRHEGHYRWIGDGKDEVRIRGGLEFDVVSHDEDAFQVKIYKIPESARTVARSEPEEEAPEIEAVEMGEVDRLRFEPFDRGLPGRGQWRNGFSLADMNGDGHLDIVHGPARKGGNNPAIFLGDGNGTWRLWSEARFPGARLDYGDTAVADFDGDGHLDVAFASHLRGLKVFVGDGRGGFTEWSEGIPFQVAGGGRGAGEFSSRVVEAVDWNGDGLPDLLTLGEGPRFARAGDDGSPQYYDDSSGPVIFLNRGDGTWEVRTQEAEGRRHYGDTLAVADFDGDGRLDFVVGTAASGKRDLLHLAPAEGSDAPWEAVEIPALPQGGPTYRGLAASDFDEDGAVDLAIGYARREGETWVTGVDVLLARGDGEWESRPVLAQEGAMGIWALAAGDLDGDGHTDLAAFDGRGDGYLFLGAGDGSFVREGSSEVGPPEPGCRGYHAAIRDLDGDGRGELLAGFAGEPGSEQLLGLPKSCPGGGALRAWSPAPGPGPAPAAEE